MSPATILRIHSIISSALDLAVRYDWIDRNVAKNANPPHPRKREPNPPTPDQAARLLNLVWAEDEEFGHLPESHVAMLSGVGHAGSVGNEPEAPRSRQEEIRQRIGTIHLRIEELRAKRRGGGVAPASERQASAQRDLTAAQAAADQAVAAAIRAYGRAADAHERAAMLHERAAAAESGDKDEHERQAVLHRTAAVADTERAGHARSLLRQDAGPDAPVTPADSSDDSNGSDHRPPAATASSA
jgi:hypothetical protein